MPTVEISPEQAQAIAENCGDCETVSITTMDNGNVRVFYIEGDEKTQIDFNEEGDLV